jgi:nucleotide-binding universal stress UspA family protein
VTFSISPKLTTVSFEKRKNSYGFDFCLLYQAKIIMEKILVPVDGSEATESAIKYACFLAGKIGATITILYVVTPSSEPELVHEINIQPLQAYGQKILKKAKEIAKENNCEVTTELRMEMGNAGNEIVKVSDEGKFSMIIMSATSHTMVSHLMGSVSDRVLHRAFCPVLIIRKH